MKNKDKIICANCGHHKQNPYLLCPVCGAREMTIGRPIKKKRSIPLEIKDALLAAAATNDADKLKHIADYLTSGYFMAPEYANQMAQELLRIAAEMEV
jgi:uncharacterized Zn finger protein (UPF0148 family)